MTKFISPLFWQSTIAAIIFTLSGAGYYTGQGFSDYMTKGYYTQSITDLPPNPLTFVGTLTSVICVLLLFARVPKRIPTAVMVVLPMQIWIMTSAFWSNTMIPTAIVTLKCLIYANALDMCATQLNRRQIVASVFGVILLVLAVSIALCLLDPIFRISIGAEGWRGLFVQKNRLASFCLFSMILIGTNFRSSLIAGIFLMLIDLYVMIMSQGKTEISIAIMYVILTQIMKIGVSGYGMPKQRLTKFTISLGMVFFVSFSVIIYLIDIGSITFSGRTGLWNWYLRDLGSQFLIGKGGITAPADVEFVDRVTKSGLPPTCDSSYVMMLYNNGLIGIFIFFSSLAFVCFMAISKNSKRAISVICAIFCYSIFAAMESDTRLMVYFSTFSIILVYIILEKAIADENSTVGS